MIEKRHSLQSPPARTYHIAQVLQLVGIMSSTLEPLFQPTQFFNAWHYAFFFTLGIPLGGLALTMLHHLTGGNWGLAIRRECEAAALTLPLMAILFIPVALGTYHLFPWGDAELVKHDKILQH